MILLKCNICEREKKTITTTTISDSEFIYFYAGPFFSWALINKKKAQQQNKNATFTLKCHSTTKNNINRQTCKVRTINMQTNQWMHVNKLSSLGLYGSKFSVPFIKNNHSDPKKIHTAQIGKSFSSSNTKGARKRKRQYRTLSHDMFICPFTCLVHDTVYSQAHLFFFYFVPF